MVLEEKFTKKDRYGTGPDEIKSRIKGAHKELNPLTGTNTPRTYPDPNVSGRDRE